jgi:hypothetical protein
MDNVRARVLKTKSPTKIEVEINYSNSTEDNYGYYRINDRTQAFDL